MPKSEIHHYHQCFRCKYRRPYKKAHELQDLNLKYGYRTSDTKLVVLLDKCNLCKREDEFELEAEAILTKRERNRLY